MPDPDGQPAPHLIGGHTHPARLIGEYAFEIEAGSRNVETLSPKAIELSHLFLREKMAREDHARELRKAQR